MDRHDLDKLRGYIGEYLQQKGLSLRRPFRCLAPGHEDKNPSMSFNPRANNVHCFGCGVTYDLFDLVGLDYGLTKFSEQIAKAAECMGVSLETPQICVSRGLSGTAESNPRFDRSDELEAIQALSEGECSYFLSRGITNDSIRLYGLFQTENRAYFPVWEQGVVTSWCGRAINDTIQPRYKNSSGSMGIWNSDRLQQAGQGQELYLTEGIVDAILIEQLGYTAVALCGAQNARKLLERIRPSCGWQYVLCGDDDDAGKAMNQTLAAGLAEQGIPFRILVPRNGDWCDMYLRDREGLKEYLRLTEAAMLQSTLQWEKVEPNGKADSQLPCTADLVDAFFAHSLRRREAVETGIAGLDKLLDGGLYAGLYVLGAISSLGKTSLALQMADTIAASGRDVLFLSLEQSRFELMAKSMSRISAEIAGRREAFTARELMRGIGLESFTRMQLLEETRTTYRNLAKRLYILEGMGDMGVPQLREKVEQCQQQTGQAPVVVVDYLQILAPWDMRASDKQNTDRSVVELRRLSREFEIPILAISSFNRENYRSAVSMEAFKESGAVEYSADVLLGIQLAGVGEKGFDVNAAKLKTPRQVELVLLKNRNGIPYGKVPLRYDARFGLFDGMPSVASKDREKKLVL